MPALKKGSKSVEHATDGEKMSNLKHFPICLAFAWVLLCLVLISGESRPRKIESAINFFLKINYLRINSLSWPHFLSCSVEYLTKGDVSVITWEQSHVASYSAECVLSFSSSIIWEACWNYWWKFCQLYLVDLDIESSALLLINYTTRSGEETVLCGGVVTSYGTILTSQHCLNVNGQKCTIW